MCGSKNRKESWNSLAHILICHIAWKNKIIKLYTIRVVFQQLPNYSIAMSGRLNICRMNSNLVRLIMKHQEPTYLIGEWETIPKSGVTWLWFTVFFRPVRSERILWFWVRVGNTLLRNHIPGWVYLFVHQICSMQSP